MNARQHERNNHENQKNNKKRLEQLADLISLPIKFSRKDGWLYWESGVWIDLGRNNKAAEENLLQMCKTSVG